MRKSSIYIFGCLFSTLLLGCSASSGGSGGGGNRDTTFYFELDSDYQPVKRSGVGSANQLLVGDLTDDSFDDLLILTRTSGMILYKNTDGSGFSSGTSITTTFQNNPVGAVYGNDVIVAEESTGTVRYLNNTDGNGTFSMVTGYEIVTGSATTQLTTAGAYVMIMNAVSPILADIGASDFLNDGTVAVFAGQTARARSGLLNTDSYEDFLFLAESGSQTPIIYKGSSTGPTTTASTISRSQSDDVSDFVITNLTGNTRPDVLLVTNDDLEVLKNESTTAFVLSTETNFDINVAASRAVSADFLLEDGRNDIYVTRSGSTGQLYYNSSADSLVFEDVTSQAFATGDLESDPVDVVTGDFDGDGRIDIAELSDDGSISVYMNTGKTETP